MPWSMRQELMHLQGARKESMSPVFIDNFQCVPAYRRKLAVHVT